MLVNRAVIFVDSGITHGVSCVPSEAPLCTKGTLVLVNIADFNNAANLFNGPLAGEWTELQETLEDMPLHLKPSEQANKVGSPIFDVVATNEYIHHELTRRSWYTKVRVPKPVAFLGTDIDFFKSSALVEVQFSNYPFFLNNLVRSELFYKSQTLFANQTVSALVIITKAGFFPASNSTLYYEQARNQMQALTDNNVFDMPIRVVGLSSPLNTQLTVRWTSYPNQRSRVTANQTNRQCVLTAGRGKNARVIISFV